MDKNSIEKSKQLIAQSEAILIGAGAGLSTAGGLKYSGKRFNDNFADYIEKYQLTDMYSSAFYPFPSPEEKWGYFSRHIKLNRFDAPVGQVYDDLWQMVKHKPHFVITTNADAQFYKSGFESENIFATQGDYAKFQCKVGCHDTLYDNEEIIHNMVLRQQDLKIPTELLPICPKCGEDLVAHLRIDNHFVENSDWHQAKDHYVRFINKHKNKKLVLLELGIGFNTPSIIRWPFEQMAIAFKKSTLIRINYDNVDARYGIPDKSILLKGDISQFFHHP